MEQPQVSVEDGYMGLNAGCYREYFGHSPNVQAPQKQPQGQKKEPIVEKLFHLKTAKKLTQGDEEGHKDG